MRIESVTAHAFGALVDEQLALAPGMTVVVGDNESAKSTWHAAIYASLCGRARRRGALPAEERQFADLHKPWDGTGWEVSAVVALDDGRRIELRHDLAGNAVCSATDLQMARDVSSEIIEDGSPNAAVWSGLGRRAFLATACINQAQLLTVLQEAKGLQTALQRAAAAAGVDATAAEALRRLGEFQRESVGRNDGRSTRPLRRASVALVDAEAALAAAVSAHAGYLAAVEEADRLRAAAEAASVEVAVHEAAASRRQAELLMAQRDRVETLCSQVGEGPPPQRIEMDALATQVARALEAWERRPASVALDGPNADELSEQIAALPDLPLGDVAVDLSVQQAAEELHRARQAVAFHEQARPEATAHPLPDVSVEEVLDLARVLDTSPPEREDADRQLAAAEERVAVLTGAERRARAISVLGVVLVVLGGVLGALATPPLAVVALLGIALGARGLLTGSKGRLELARTERTELAVRARALASASERMADERQAAEERCAALGLPAVTADLRRLGGELTTRAGDVRMASQWEERRRALAADERVAVKVLDEALVARGVMVDGDVALSYRAYADACAARSALAVMAGRRADLEARVLARRRAEGLAAESGRAAQLAVEQVLAAAEACSLVPGDVDEAVAALGRWEQDRRWELELLDVRLDAWSELQALLAGSTVEQLASRTAQAVAEAEELAAGLSRERVADAAPGDPDRALSELRRRDKEQAEEAAAARRAVADLAHRLASVAEAEEALAAAQEQLAWLEELDETLATTQRFMSAAQEQVQRDLAPVLTQTLEQWLPSVTAGRYRRAIVDLATLDVQVCGEDGRWRRASLLSHGTAEQIYLLLRVSLARHLTAGRDRCPMLLDDVTVHADDGRTEAILDMLHRMSTEQQVIVFTQERRVAAWAADHLTEEGIRRLSVLTSTYSRAEEPGWRPSAGGEGAG